MPGVITGEGPQGGRNVHRRCVVCCGCKCFPAPALGCKGLSSRRSSNPLPFRPPWPSAPAVAGPGRSLKLARTEGQGLTPLHPCSLRSHAASAAKAVPHDVVCCCV